MTEFSFGLINVIVFLLLAMLFVLGSLAFGWLIRPKRPSLEKNSAYECGERPIGPAWFNFNPRFYIIALIFLIFDVEVAFTLPVAAVFSDWLKAGKGAVAFVELAIFLLILLIGLVYVWAKGDLEWLKKLDHDVD